MEVTGTGDETRLSGVMRLVEDAQKSKSRKQHLADRAARLLTGGAIADALHKRGLEVAMLTGGAFTLAGVRPATNVAGLEANAH